MSNFIGSLTNYVNSTTQYVNTVAQTVTSQGAKIIKSEIEKCSYVGGYALMCSKDFIFGKEDLCLPKYVENNFIHAGSEDLDKMIGSFTSNDVEPLATSILNIYDPIQRGFSNTDQKVELVSKYLFPKEILEERFREFYNFVVESKVYLQTSYFEHPVLYFDNDIFLNVQGKYIGSKEILKNFALKDRSARERLFLPPFIISRATGERWAYLQGGLIPHNSEKDLRPYKIISPQNNNDLPQLEFKIHNTDLDSTEGQRNPACHAWCSVINTQGECYSFGLYAQGVIQCPDPSEFDDAHTFELISCKISDEEVQSIIAKIEQIRKETYGKYHLTKYNCSSFVSEVAATINLNVLGKNQLNTFNNFKNRIRMYAVSSLLSNHLKTPNIVSKIAAIKEAAQLKENIENLPRMIKENYSLDRSMESLVIKEILDTHPDIKEALLKLPQILNGVIEIDSVENIVKWGSSVSSKEIKDLCNSILLDSSRQLTHKIYHLLESVLTNFSQYEVTTPNFLGDDLKKLSPSTKSLRRLSVSNHSSGNKRKRNDNS